MSYDPDVDLDDIDTDEDAIPSTRDHHGVFALPKGRVVAVICLGVAQAVVLLCSLILLQQIVRLLPVNQQLMFNGPNQALLLTGLLAVAAIVLGALRALEFSVCETAGYKVVRRLRMVMYAHLLRMTPGQLRGRARGGLLLRLTGDLSMLRMWLSRGVLIGTSSAIVLVAGIAAAIWLDPAMGLVLIAMFSLAALASLATGAPMRRATRAMRRRRSLLMGNIDEQINALEIVQLAGRSKGEYSRLSRQNETLVSALIRIVHLRAWLRALTVSAGFLATAAVLAVGIVRVFSGGTTLAIVVAEVAISRFLTGPVRSLGLAHDYWHRGQVSKRKILDFLHSSARPDDADQLPRLKVKYGTIEFVDVCVPAALDGFSATATQGQIVAIVGAPGSGAGTLLEIVARLVDPESGTVRVDEQDLVQTAPWSAGRQVGYYQSDSLLMRGTIGRNLSYAMPDADHAEIQRVVLGLGLDDLLSRLGPEGTKTWVTEGGRNLTPYDRNLVCFARALMGNPRILLLDDPLGGLHPDDRDKARSLILRHPGTVLWHTSEFEDLSVADQIWFVEAGRLVRTSTGKAYVQDRWEEKRKVVA
ncbi:MAG: ABC transporter ATP-binding protein/permease [Propionibacteriaceae bacterium]|nr:ABC transporter ATP-binding protein/permease [Propionibacteriaceae bacterium]